MKIKIMLFVLLAAVAAWLLFNSAKEIKKSTAAMDAYNAGNFEKASGLFGEMLQRNPDNTEINKNAAAAAYKTGNTQEAGKIYGQLLENGEIGLKDKADIMYNLGNAEFKNKRYEKAQYLYREALKINPGDKDAKINLEIARKMLEQKHKREQSYEEVKKELDKNKQRQKENESESEQAEEQERLSAQKEAESAREKEISGKNMEDVQKRIASEDDQDKKKELARELDRQKQSWREAERRQLESAKRQKEARELKAGLEKKMGDLKGEQRKLERKLKEAENRERKNYGKNASGENSFSRDKTMDGAAEQKEAGNSIGGAGRREAEALSENKELEKELALSETREKELAEELQKLSNAKNADYGKRQKQELVGEIEKQKKRRRDIQKRIDENKEKISRERQLLRGPEKEEKALRKKNSGRENVPLSKDFNTAGQKQNYAHIDTILNYYKEEDKKSDRFRNKNANPVVERVKEDW